MNYIKHLNGFFQRLEVDEKITSHHISLYMALFRLWNMNRFREQFEVNRQELMGLSRIGSPHTYARCMKQLNDWRYIKYSPSSNRFSVSKVSCVRFDITTDTTNSITTNTATVTANSTLLLNYSNNINSKRTSDFFENGRGKIINGKSQHHVNNDKDYSEPL
jgi:hypothetical protein